MRKGESKHSDNRAIVVNRNEYQVVDDAGQRLRRDLEIRSGRDYPGDGSSNDSGEE